VNLSASEVSEARVLRISEICSGHRGKSQVCVRCLLDSGHRVEVGAGKRFNVRADMDFYKKLEEVVGEGKVKFSN
jgi:hypothetical protein